MSRSVTLERLQNMHSPSTPVPKFVPGFSGPRSGSRASTSSNRLRPVLRRRVTRSPPRSSTGTRHEFRAGGTIHRALFVAATILAFGCTDDFQALDIEDAEPTDQGEGPRYDPDGAECPLPSATCSIDALAVVPTEELPSPGAGATVTAIEVEGDEVRLSLGGGPLVLPAMPDLAVGDEVTIGTSERGGVVLEKDGEWVAFVATRLGATDDEVRAIREELEDSFSAGRSVSLDVLGIPLSAEAACGGWRLHVGFNNGCSDIPMVGFSIRSSGVVVPPGEVRRFTAPSGDTVAFHNRAIAVPYDTFDEECIRCAAWVTTSCARCASYDPHATRFAMVREAP